MSKKGHIISGFVGTVLGTVATLGGQAILNDTPSNNYEQSNYVSNGTITNFDIVKYDENGDVFITRSGKKYHYEWCPVIKSKQTQRVNSSDAENVGLSPCKRCHN